MSTAATDRLYLVVFNEYASGPSNPPEVVEWSSHEDSSGGLAQAIAEFGKCIVATAGRVALIGPDGLKIAEV